MHDRDRDAGAGRDIASGRGRRRLAYGLAVLVLVLGGIYVLVTQVALQPLQARDDVERRLTALAGRPVVIDGTVDFTLLPKPTAQLTNVSILAADGADPYRLDVELVIAELDPLDALFGRTVIDRLTLVRPEGGPGTLDTTTIAPLAPAFEMPDLKDFDPDDDGDAFRALARLFLSRFEGVRELSVRNGAFRTRGGGIGFSSVNLDFDWPAANGEAALAGNFVWNGEPVELRTSAANGADLRDGGATPVTVNLTSPSVVGSFRGTASIGDAALAEGRLDVSTPSLSRAARWLGRPDVAVPDFGAFRLETDIRLDGERADLASASVDLGGFLGRGALEASRRADGRVAVAGTLAFDRLPVDRFARAVAPLPRNVLELQRPIAVAFMRDFDLDLRVSASAATILDRPVRELAATVKVAGGLATIDVGDAEFLGGRANATLALDLNATRPMAKARLALQGAEIGELLTLAGVQSFAIAGPSAVSASFAGPLSNWGDILRQNVVAAQIEMRGGVLTGVDRDAFLTVGERVLQPAARTVSFGRLVARVRTDGPRAWIETIEMEGPEGTLALAGMLSFSNDRVALDGTFRPGGDVSFTPSQPLRFTIVGEWPSPLVTVAAVPEPI